MKTIPINFNLFDGDCSLWYDVVVKVTEKIGNCTYVKHIHCVCPHCLCKSFEEAIAYYWKYFHKELYEPLVVQHHKYSKTALDQLALAC